MIPDELRIIQGSLKRLIIKCASWIYYRPKQDFVFLILLHTLPAMGQLFLRGKDIQQTSGLTKIFLLLSTLTYVITLSYVISWILANLVLRMFPTGGMPTRLFKLLRESDLGTLTEGTFNPLGNGEIEINKPGFITDFFEFCDDDEKAMISGTMNGIAYSQKLGIWATSIANKQKRNKLHARKNKLCLLLIGDSKKKSLPEPKIPYVGFTHVIPINKDTWDNYSKGNIADNTFPSRYVYSSPETAEISGTNDNPYGLLIFSIAAYKPAGNKNEDHHLILELIFKGLGFHIYKLLETHFPNIRRVPVMIQPPDTYFNTLLLRLKFELKGTSRDGFPILVGHLLH